MAEDPVLGLAQAIIMIGPEHAPDGLLGSEYLGSAVLLKHRDHSHPDCL